MTAIIIPRKHYTQPKGRVEVDWSNTFSSRLSLLFDGDSLLDAATAQPFSAINSPAHVATKKGIGRRLNGSSQAINTGRKITAASGTVLCITENIDTELTSKCLFAQTGDLDGNFIGLGVQGHNFFLNGTTVPVDMSSPDFEMAATWGASGIKTYSAGRQISSTSYTEAPKAATGNYFFEIGAFSYSGGRIFHRRQDVLLFSIFDKQFSQEEILELSANPWQLFRADPIRIYSLPSGAITLNSLTMGNLTQTTARATLGLTR